MSKEDILKYCLDAKLIIEINGEYFPIQKKPGIIKGGKCKNLPDKYLTVSIKQIYKYFMNDCEIPSLSSGSLVYSLREESVGALAVMRAIIENPTIDFLILVQKIKAFYKLSGKTTVHPKFCKFLEQGVWESIYENKVVKNTNDDYVDSM